METIIGSDIYIAKQLLTHNELVAIPTETVYGLAANAFNPIAVNKIFEAKNRPKTNPLIIHVSNILQIKCLVKEIPPAALELLKAFTPGPLTLLLPKNNLVPDIVTAGLPNIAIRIPAHKIALALLDELDFPLAAPSANPFGYISPTSAMHVKSMLNNKIPYILDGGNCQVGIESTIVGFKNNQPIIYRQGLITQDEIKKCIGEAYINKTKAIISPGMHSSHYSPHTPLYIAQSLEPFLKKFKIHEVGLITYNEYSKALPQTQQILLFQSNNYKLAATNLYASLHEMDKRNYKAIVVNKLPDTGICAAINDRLTRAAKK